MKKNRPIWDIIIEECILTNDYVLHGMTLDMTERRDTGYKEYKTHLTVNTPIDSIQYGYEEALDLLVYVKKGILEGKLKGNKWKENYNTILRLCKDLRIAKNTIENEENKDQISGDEYIQKMEIW